MSSLKIRFRLNPGRKGIALGKLSKQTENIELFLRSIASDLGADDAKNVWLADKFRNSSAIYNAELQAVVEAATAAEFNHAISALTKYQSSSKSKPPYVSDATIERFAHLRQCLDDDEQMGIALIDVETGKAKRFSYVDKLQLEAIGNSIEAEIKYIGAVMGYTHEWNKGANNPFLYVRELNSGELIKCSYDDGDYDRVAKLFAKKTSVVIITGTIIFNSITSKTEVVRATGFDCAPDFTNDDFNKFFGAAPNITGNMTSEAFIAKGRDDEQ
jgi:hypothetical protein